MKKFGQPDKRSLSKFAGTWTLTIGFFSQKPNFERKRMSNFFFHLQNHVRITMKLWDSGTSNIQRSICNVIVIYLKW